MRFINNRFFNDIYLGFFISSLFLLIFFFMPGSKLIRGILGIPFLFFIPGYMLTALLFPPVHEDEEEWEEAPPVKRSRSAFKFKKKEDDKDEVRIEKGVDWPIRIALSVGISLAVVGLVSWILNDLYPVNEQLFGVRSDMVVLVIYFLTTISGGGAIIRRAKLDPSMIEKFAIPKVRLFEKDPKDIIITSALIVILISAIGFGVYLRQYHHPDSDRYTELYILGPDEKIEDYPDIIKINQYQKLHLGLINHEFETRDYNVIISLDHQGVQHSINDLEFLHMNRSIRYLFTATLDHGQRFQEPMSFLIDTPGEYLFSIIVLNKDGSMYREVKLKITVLS